MIGKQTGSWRSVWHGVAVLLLLAGLAAIGGGGARAAAPASAAGQNTLEGSVTVDAGGPAAGAIVVALQDDQRQHAAVDGSGAYSMTLDTGDWHVTIAPPPTTTSPTWDYTGGAQFV